MLSRPFWQQFTSASDRGSSFIAISVRIFKTVRSHNINFESAADGHSAVNVEEIKVAPYSFSGRKEWELNWHKRAREERDSPSQMTCANQPPRRTFPKPD